MSLRKLKGVLKPSAPIKIQVEEPQVTEKGKHYPELFDRTLNTLAATYPKYGDVAYSSPVQRIGSFMDNTARLKKKHLLEMITFLKT